MCVEVVVAKVEIEDAGLTISRYLVSDEDRHGNKRFYFRRGGQKKVRLRAEPGTAAFLEEFKAAYHGRHQVQKAAAAEVIVSAPVRRNPAPGSLAWLFNEYEARSERFKDSGDTTKSRRRKVMDQICAEPVSDKDQTPVGLRPFAGLRPKAIKVICHRCSTPATINARLKAFREALKFAIEEDWLTANPGREVAYKQSKSGGYHTWTVEEVAQFEARWPVGTVQRLAVGMLMFTGTRRSDAVVIGKQHRKTVRVQIEDQMGHKSWQNVAGWQFTQFKGRDRTPVTTWIPILGALQQLIDATPSTGLTYLETSFHKPFTAKGFGTGFKKWCKLAGLPHCSAHGLRKAAATVAAERGATAHQLMAIFGWRSISQALVYTKAAEQKRLAGAAMHMLAAPTQEQDDALETKISG